MDIDRYFQQQLNDFFGNTWSVVIPKQGGRSYNNSQSITPTCHLDVKETEKGIEVRAELPGVAKEDIHVTADNQMLTISAEKKREVTEKQESYMMEERLYGKIERSIRLPKNCDPNDVKATFDNGVLGLVFAKKVEPAAKKIEIA